MSTLIVTQEQFPVSLADSILSDLSLSIRNHILFNWAHQFTQRADQDPLLTEIISTITTLDFSSHRSIDPNNFFALTNLPLSGLKHLNLSRTPLTSSTVSEILGIISKSPVFDNLESLNMSRTSRKKLDDLFAGSNSFPKLTTLNLSNNWGLSINSLFNTDKLPNLKHLDLSRCDLSKNAFETMAQSNGVTFKLESLDLSMNLALHHRGVGADPFVAFFKAPFLANIKDLNLANTHCSLAAISFLVDDQNGPFARNHIVDSHQQSQEDCINAPNGYNQLTSLSWGGYNGMKPLNQKTISDIASSSTVTGLAQLTLSLDRKDSVDLAVLGKSKNLSNLKELSIHFNSNESSLSRLLCPDGDNIPRFRLEKLEIGWAKLSLEDIKTLCTAPCLSTLKSLSLSSCTIKSDEGGNNNDKDSVLASSFDWNDAFELLSRSTIISKLTHLNLKLAKRACQSQTGLKSLLRSDLLSADLIELDLSHHELDTECLEIITSRRINEGDETSPLQFGKLQQLHLGSCRLENGSLCNISKLTELRYLDISYYCGDDSDDLIRSLISTQDTLPFFPKLANLTDLNICHSNITNSGALSLSQSQLLNSLVELNISYNHLGTPGLEALLTTKLVSKLQFLDIYDNLERVPDDQEFPYLRDCQVRK